MTERAKVRLSPSLQGLAALVGGAMITTIAPDGARADASHADQAAAEVLFNDAAKLMAQGKLDEACPKFVESQRLDPTPGTLLNIGDCYEKAGKTATSYGAFIDAEAEARRAGDKARQREAARRAKLLEPRLSTLTITVNAATAADGLEVRRDGRTVGKDLWGTSIPVDPGEHRVEATAPGRKPWMTVVQVEAKPGTMTLSLPELAPVPVDLRRQEGPSASVEGGWSTHRIAGLAVGGVGVVGIAIGSVFGGLTLSKSSASKEHCTKDLARCDQIGFDLQHGAAITAKVSDAAFAIGGAALVGGVVLVVTAPSRSDQAMAKRALRVQVGPAAGAQTTGIFAHGVW